MPAFLFQLLDVREPRRRWRAFPVSLLLHVLIAAAASLVVARPVARALEEERPRLLVLGASQGPRPVAT